MYMLSPYYADNSITIYHGNCLDILPLLDKGDLLLTDPPYSYKQVGGGLISKRKTYTQIQTELSSFDLKIYEKLLMSCTNNSHGYCFASKNLLKDYINMAENNNLSWDILVYGKNNPPPMKNNRYLSSFEHIFFFRGKGCYWNNDAPFSFYSKLKMVNCRKSQFGHPTEKNLKVIEELMMVSSDVGHTIIDPFMGSGTTLIAAKKLNRKSIGIEIEEKYCEIAVNRISTMLNFEG